MFVETLITIVAIKISVIFVIILDIWFFLKEKAKHGEWIIPKLSPDSEFDAPYVMCSICKETEDYNSPYCPNCGAKMDISKMETTTEMER